MQSLWMVGAAFAFALMGAVVKHVSAWHSAFEIVFNRGAVSALLMGGVIFASVIGRMPFDDRFEWIQFAGILLIAASAAVAPRVSAASTATAVRPARVASA